MEKRDEKMGYVDPAATHGGPVFTMGITVIHEGRRLCATGYFPLEAIVMSEDPKEILHEIFEKIAEQLNFRLAKTVHAVEVPNEEIVKNSKPIENQ